LIFVSCASVSQANRSSAVNFTAVETVKPDWQSIADGVGFFHGKISDPQLEFWALNIDLSSPNIQIVVRDGMIDDGSSVTRSAKVSSFVRDNNLVAGINALPFDVITSREGLPVKNIGLVISGGRLLSPANPNYDALVFYKNAPPAITAQSAIKSIESIENAAGGFHKILADGEPAQRTRDREDRHPRSAAGISANGTVLYLLVIDGRRSGSIGGTEKETALLLRALGSHNGINFDGGGSSALVIRNPDGSIKTVNTPVHGIPGRERAVAGCLGVILSRGK
jgi:exopolysaccharide biosynthesis protein